MNYTPAKIWPKELLYWRRMSSKDISDYVARTPPRKRLVLIVWGVLEAHGPYMPLCNDSHLASLAADKVAQTLYKRHGIQPIIFNSWVDVGSRSATWKFPGAIGFHSSHTPIIREIFEQTIERMVHEGFTRFFVVNGDGGNWMNHWFGIQWDSKVIRDLREKHDIILRGSNWDQEGGSAYLHAGVYDHALITWACKYAPEFERMSAIRHGLRAPDESELKEIENDQAFLEDDPYRETDWSTYKGQDRLRSVTKFVYQEYVDALYDKSGKPLKRGGAKADFDAKIENLMKKVLAVVDVQ